MEVSWHDGLWVIGASLVVLAVGVVSRMAVHLVLSWWAATWWNEMVTKAQDEQHDVFEQEQHRLDAAQAAALSVLTSPSTPRSDSVTHLYLELTRMRMRLDVMRVESHAQYAAESARSQFSDLEIVWLWLRHHRNPKAKLDAGTTRRFMPLTGRTRDTETIAGIGTAPPESAGATNETAPQPSQPVGVPATLPHAVTPPGQGMIVLPAPTVLITEQLERLAALRDRGAISQEEFAKLKAVLLDF